MTATGLSCGSCGTELSEKAKFCSECGAAVATATAPAEYQQVTVLFADVVHSMDIAAAVGAERLLRFWIVEGVLIMDPMSAVAPYNHEGVPDPARAALLVIDMQEHFADIATAILPAVSSLVTAARNADMPVFYTRHGHQDLSVDGGVLAAWWGGDLSMVGDADWRFLSRITPRPRDPIIDKTRYSAFFGTQLASMLSARDVSDLVICGVVTNCCCETTARDGFMRDYNVFVAADATAATNEDLHISSLKGMAYACARVLTTVQLCDAFERQSPRTRRFLGAGP